MRKYSNLYGPDAAQLVRIVVNLERKPSVQTCGGVSEDDPWYLAVLGDVSPYPHRQNTWNDLATAGIAFSQIPCC